VREALGAAEVVLTSDLTLIECDRVLIRAVAGRRLGAAEARRLADRLKRTTARWSRLRIADEVVERARRPFPGEPLRALDAIHLASALILARSLPELSMLSLDERIRSAGQLLGLPVAPA
jgi:predicted nucleic acid-binding protein